MHTYTNADTHTSIYLAREYFSISFRYFFLTHCAHDGCHSNKIPLRRSIRSLRSMELPIIHLRPKPFIGRKQSSSIAYLFWNITANNAVHSRPTYFMFNPTHPSISTLTSTFGYLSFRFVSDDIWKMFDGTWHDVCLMVFHFLLKDILSYCDDGLGKWKVQENYYLEYVFVEGDSCVHFSPFRVFFIFSLSSFLFVSVLFAHSLMSDYFCFLNEWI